VTAQILIIDDHPIFCKGLKLLIDNEDDMHVCCEAASSEEALKHLKLCDVDLATVDLSLAGTSGLQLIKNIRIHHKKVKLLVSSMHDELMFAERCVHAGANGYINKEEAPQKIIAAIRTVLSGQYYLSDNMTKNLAQRNLNGGSQASKSPVEILSNRELEVFMLIGEGKNSQKIAGLLNISSKTVDTHKEHIKKKLGIHDKFQLIQQAVAWSIRESMI
jgi:DNA-binding NarL/FixJ family response regulator